MGFHSPDAQKLVADLQFAESCGGDGGRGARPCLSAMWAALASSRTMMCDRLSGPYTPAAR